jgi:hypothetical protein
MTRFDAVISYTLILGTPGMLMPRSGRRPLTANDAIHSDRGICAFAPHTCVYRCCEAFLADKGQSTSKLSVSFIASVLTKLHAQCTFVSPLWNRFQELVNSESSLGFPVSQSPDLTRYYDDILEDAAYCQKFMDLPR